MFRSRCLLSGPIGRSCDGCDGSWHSPGLPAPRPRGGAPAAGEQHCPLLVVHLRVEVLRVLAHWLEPRDVVEPVKLRAQSRASLLYSRLNASDRKEGWRGAYIIGDPVEGGGDLAVGLAALVVPRRVVDRVPLFVVVLPRQQQTGQCCSAPDTPGPCKSGRTCDALRPDFLA